MGVEALVAALEEDAAREVDTIRTRAGQEADALRQAAEQAATAALARCRQEVEERHAVAAAAEVSSAIRGARLRVLEAQRAWLERVRADVESALAALPLESWEPAIPVLVGTALQYAGHAAVTIQCPLQAEDAVWALAGARLDTTVRAVEGMEPGLLLRSDDGRLTVPLTVRSRLAARWPDLQLLALASLESAP